MKTLWGHFGAGVTLSHPLPCPPTLTGLPMAVSKWPTGEMFLTLGDTGQATWEWQAQAGKECLANRNE